MADTNDSFHREVQEELKREQYAEFWKRYGTYVIAAVATVVLSVFGFQYWQSSKKAAAERAGADYEVAARLLKDGKTDDAKKALEGLSGAGASGYEILSKLQLAGLQRKAGKNDEALKAYQQIAATSGIDPLFRDFAKLQTAAMELGTADYTELKNRLSDLMKDENAFRYTARELVGLSAFQAGDLKAARETFNALLGDASVPPGMAQRVRMVLARISEKDIAADTAADAAKKTNEADKNKAEDKSSKAPAATSGSSEKSAGGESVAQDGAKTASPEATQAAGEKK